VADHLHMRQESPANRRYAPGPMQVSTEWGKEGSSWSGCRGPSWRSVSAGHASNSARCRSHSRLVDRYIVLLRCCILLLYQAPELWAQDFEFISLTWVELRGFEPLTSCMPSTGSTSTAVRLCRSPSQEVLARPVKSAPVAVLSCCTGHPARSGPERAPDQPEPPKKLYRGASPGKPSSDRAT